MLNPIIQHIGWPVKPPLKIVKIKTQTNYWLEETSGGLSTIDRVDAWLERQRLFELVDPEKISSFLKRHQEILPELDTIASEIFSDFTDDRGGEPELSLLPGYEISEGGEIPREYIVIWVWFKMDPEEAFRRTKRFNRRWWLNQPGWLRQQVVIDIAFKKDE